MVVGRKLKAGWRKTRDGKTKEGDMEEEMKMIGGRVLVVSRKLKEKRRQEMRGGRRKLMEAQLKKGGKEEWKE